MILSKWLCSSHSFLFFRSLSKKMQIIAPQRGPRDHHDNQTTQTSKDSEAQASQASSSVSKVNKGVCSAPGTESTTCLLNQLVSHFTKECHSGIYIRDRVEEAGLHKKLKTTVYSVLLSHRKGVNCIFEWLKLQSTTKFCFHDVNEQTSMKLRQLMYTSLNLVNCWQAWGNQENM